MGIDMKKADLNFLNLLRLALKQPQHKTGLRALFIYYKIFYGSALLYREAKALKEKGFDIAKDQIEVSHIKELGEQEVVINFNHGLEARITLIINPE